MTASPQSVARQGLASQMARLRGSRLIRQNLVLFAGGLIAGVGGFVYHALAARALGPQGYGEVASLVAIFTVGATGNQILILVLARYAANLEVEGRRSAIRYAIGRSTRLLLLPGAPFILLAVALSFPASRFLHIPTAVPLMWTGVGIVAYWYLAVPRGVLQGMQRFPALSANLASELMVRTGCLVLLLGLGLSVTGAAVALLAGAAYGFVVGLYTVRDVLALAPERVRLRSMARFALTAAAGTVGVILLYNVDVVLAKHYLSPHDAGIYGGLNKIGFIVFALTLSVSQVLFPRVVEAVASQRHPGRLLLLSAGLISFLGLGAVAVFGVAPGLVVRVLFGPAFAAARPYVLFMGLIGLALSLDNLLVQFFMAVHDRVFVPLLGSACVLQATLIVLFHATIGQVVADVLSTVTILLLALALRFLLLLPHLRPEMVAED
ncbi:MAG: oligosaccharide flippase family protein [Candidatus Dormibacteraeota bacterium]|nr:oligosaccharide flippase family protein [Candidatus Dormibacteraeota bacterium]